MEETLMEVKGVNGQLQLLPGKVRIKRQGFVAFMGHGFKGDKDILISSISSIQYKKAGMMVNGYIQFAFLGGTEAKGGVFQATQDENTVMFTMAQMPDFDRFKAAVEEQMIEARTPKAQAVGSNMSVYDEIERLGELKAKGYISEADYEAKKKQLLGL